jgi:hypothetical protein
MGYIAIILLSTVSSYQYPYIPTPGANKKVINLINHCSAYVCYLL